MLFICNRKGGSIKYENRTGLYNQKPPESGGRVEMAVGFPEGLRYPGLSPNQPFFLQCWPSKRKKKGQHAQSLKSVVYPFSFCSLASFFLVFFF